jgi:hypothetical protein
VNASDAISTEAKSQATREALRLQEIRTGSAEKPMSWKTTDPRQLDLFGGRLPEDDPVATYYRRLRRAGLWLVLDPKTDDVHPTSESDGVPGWAHREALIHQDRIKADVLRSERSIVRSLEREMLEGGAELIRLPGYPQLDPPARPSLRRRPWNGPAA